MSFSRFAKLAGPALPSLAAVLLCLLASDAMAVPRHGELVSSLAELFPRQAAPGVILAAARRLFWTLATMSLVWSFGVLLLRRADIGEVLLELLRFMVFTGIFYWLLSGASTSDGFVYAVFDSFKLMSGVSDAATRGDNIIQLGLDIFYKVLEQSQNWKEADVLVAAGLSVAIIVALTLLAAQIALIVVMAWMLAYGGIFLLGMGGARWTSPIAVGFYKHVLALGMALLVLALLLKVGQSFLQAQASRVLTDGSNAKGLDYVSLADMFVVALLLSVLGIRLPGLIYTLVTGSRLGLLAGTAGMAGSVLAAGGGHAYAAAYSALYPAAGGARGHDGASGGPDASPGGGGAIQSIYRAAGRAPTDDAIFEPFGPRPTAGAGTVFSQYRAPSAYSPARTTTQPATDTAQPAAAPHTDPHRGPPLNSGADAAVRFTAGHTPVAASENKLPGQQASVGTVSLSQKPTRSSEAGDGFAPLAADAPGIAASPLSTDAGLAGRPGLTASSDHSAMTASSDAMDATAPEQLARIGSGRSDAATPLRQATSAGQSHPTDTSAPDRPMPAATGTPPAPALHGPSITAEPADAMPAPMSNPTAEQASLSDATAWHRMPAAAEHSHATGVPRSGQPIQASGDLPGAAPPPPGQLAPGTTSADAWAAARDALDIHTLTSTTSAGEARHQVTSAAQRDSATAPLDVHGYRAVPEPVGDPAHASVGVPQGEAADLSSSALPHAGYATPSAKLDMEGASRANEADVPVHESSVHKSVTASMEDASIETPAPRKAGIADRSTSVPDAKEEPTPADPLDDWAYGIKPVLPCDELPSHASDDEVKAFRDRRDDHGDGP